LILAPTRELAVQIEQSLRTYGRFLNLKMAVILGGVSQNSQVRALARGVDILVATPGRSWTWCSRSMSRLTRCLLIVDEADRMLDMGFIRDCAQDWWPLLPRERQSMLFSPPCRTTSSSWTQTCCASRADRSRAHRQDRRPHRPEAVFRAGGAEAPAAQRIAEGCGAEPGDRLHPHQAWRQSRLRTSVAHRRVAEAIHGNKSQNARQRAMDLFRSGKARVLVATDIAARGIDIDGHSPCHQFELPNEPESYVHRIGRTARAGGEGIAISFCDASERSYLRDIERLIRMKIEVVPHELPEMTEEQAPPDGRAAPSPRPSAWQAPRSQTWRPQERAQPRPCHHGSGAPAKAETGTIPTRPRNAMDRAPFGSGAMTASAAAPSKVSRYNRA
jgi:ATP-dependent RNA helicase RhlE